MFFPNKIMAQYYKCFKSQAKDSDFKLQNLACIHRMKLTGIKFSEIGPIHPSLDRFNNGYIQTDTP